MECNITNFRILFPEFEDEIDYPEPRIQLFMDMTAVHIGDDPSRWCGKFEYVKCYLSAHLLVAGTKSEAGDTSASAGGLITGKSAGGVSVSYGSSSSDLSTTDAFYSSTTYGQQFLHLRNTCLVGVLVT